MWGEMDQVDFPSSWHILDRPEVASDNDGHKICYTVISQDAPCKEDTNHIPTAKRAM
jgi:hypothetical protein